MYKYMYVCVCVCVYITVQCICTSGNLFEQNSLLQTLLKSLIQTIINQLSGKMLTCTQIYIKRGALKLDLHPQLLSSMSVYCRIVVCQVKKDVSLTYHTKIENLLKEQEHPLFNFHDTVISILTQHLINI